uniref:VWFD domain-containing protein n=1 Tax=Xiphophorus couchianus TaxID=32473 RepID=A0A3B5KT40_9TELE
CAPHHSYVRLVPCQPVQLGDSFWSDSTCAQKCICTTAGLQCSNNPCSFSQICRPAAFQYSCQTVQRQTCTVSGDPHYYTFDNSVFHFQGTCTYVLSEQSQNGLPYYRVEGKNGHQGSTRVSWTVLVKVFVYDENIELVKGHQSQAKVNGSFVSTPFFLRNGSIQVYQSGFSVIVSTDFGLMVSYDRFLYVRISLPYTYQNSTCGLCGNFNNNPGDDFRTRQGEVVSSDVVFANSWKISGDDEPGCDPHCSGLACAGCTAAQTALYRNSAHCGILENSTGPFAACHQQLPPRSFVDSCVYDLCVNPASTLCEVLRDYALMCQHNGVSLGQWRNATGCELTCPPNSHYELCGSSCPSSCPSLSFPFTCDTQCQEGCQCNDGFVLNGNQCVPPTSCGCFHDGRYRQAGEQFWDGEECQSFCTCNGVTGVVQCSPNSCGPQESCHVVGGEFGCHPNPHGTCSASGDPHYLTFDGKAYDFQGTCRYVLAAVCNNTVDLHQFSVKAKNEPWFGLPVNGITRKLPIGFNGSLSVYGSGSQTVVKAKFGLNVMYDERSTVSISVPPSYRGNMCGLCGNFNGNPNDDFHTPSGASSNSADAFGAAWKVPGNYTCSDGCGSSCTQCNDDRPARAQCEVIRAADGPFSFCHEEVDPAPYFRDCAFDVCVSGNRGSDLLCRALETYVSACQSANVRIYPWRQNTTCRIECPANSHYELCGTDCGNTCASSIDAACDHVCSEGCFCNEGFSRSGTSCVPVESCGCQHDGFYFNAGESFWTDSCSQRCECQAPNVLICSPSSCTPAQECTIRGGQLGCYDAMSTCTVWGDPHYITFDGALAHFQGSCSYIITESLRHSNNETQYKVVATNKHRGNNLVSFVSSVDIYLSNPDQRVNVRLGPNKRVKVMFNAADVVVQFDGSSTLLVRMGRNYKNRVSGMCGNFNGDPNDDKVLPNAQPPFICLYLIKFQQLQTFVVINNTSGPFSSCHLHSNPQPFFTSCVYDLCLFTPANGMLCSAVSAYEKTCTNLGLSIPNWRSPLDLVFFCVVNVLSPEAAIGPVPEGCISAHLQYTVCTAVVMSDQQQYISSPFASYCCHILSLFLQAGESFWTDGCSQQCDCHAPNVLICSPSSCTPAQECTIRGGQLGCHDAMSTCTVWGDPHYITFDGAVSHFQGSCSYVITESLNHSNNDTEFKVVATNKHRGNNLVSFVSSVDIYLSNHPESVHVNGGEVSLPTTAGTFGQLMRQGSYVVFDAADVIVQFDGSSTLLVRMGRNYQNKVSGMCGNFNGDPNDDKVLPNGTLAENDNQFGHSWKSETSQAGDGLSDCRFIEEYTELCRVITNTSGPFSSCHLHSDPQPFFSSCVYDLCLYTSTNGMLCSAVSAYEKTCTVLGLSIPDWRSPLNCGIQHSSMGCSALCIALLLKMCYINKITFSRTLLSDSRFSKSKGK